MNLKRQKKKTSTKRPKWEIHAYFLDACNCDWGCPCQFNAKPTHGNCEGVASTIDDFQEPKRANVKFQAKGIRSYVKVGGNIAEALLEPIRNPVTGKVHRAIIEIPEAFESNRMEQASTKKLLAADGYLSFRYEATYGSFSENTWKGP